jgi:polysaccharide export outer membrane protein
MAMWNKIARLMQNMAPDALWHRNKVNVRSNRLVTGSPGTILHRLIDSRKLFLVTLGVFLVLMEVGCTSPTMVLPPERVMASTLIQNQKSEQQNQLINQLCQSRVKDYTDYAVGPEDLLQVTFLGQDKLGREVRVNGKGEIALPLIGAVKVAELSPQKIETLLDQLYREQKYIKNPQITVFVKEYRHQKVMVTGAVNKPGSYDIIGPRTLLEMLGRAEGLKENAGNIVQIVRHQSYSEVNKAKNQAGEQSRQTYPPGSDITEINLNQLLTKGVAGLNVPIRNGDVIYVPFASNAYVLGAVLKPGNVPVKDSLTVTQAVAMAGGLNPLLATDKISIIRIKNGHRTTIPVDLSQIETGEINDVPLKENDIVFVQESGFKKFLYTFRNLNPIPISAGAGLY